jgi:predicted transcriptional regulator
MARKPTAIVTLSLRIREELRRRVEQSAKAHQHSMNAEIIERLEASFHHQDQAADRAAVAAAAAGDAVKNFLAFAKISPDDLAKALEVVMPPSKPQLPKKDTKS